MKSHPDPAATHTVVLQALLVFALLSFLLHFAWEILQVPLFARMPVVSHWLTTVVCLKATHGDVTLQCLRRAGGAPLQTYEGREDIHLGLAVRLPLAGGMERGRAAGPLPEAGGRPPRPDALSYSAHLAV